MLGSRCGNGRHFEPVDPVKEFGWYLPTISFDLSNLQTPSSIAI